MRASLSVLFLLALVGALAGAIVGGERVLDTAALECRDYRSTDWSGEPFAIRRETGADIEGPDLATRPARFLRQYSTECEGALLITAADTYTFMLSSDDGSELRIGDRDVVLNGGRHRMKTETATIDLQPGSHRLRIRYSQEGGAFGFQLLFAWPGTALHPIRLWHVSDRPLHPALYVLRGFVPVMRVVLCLAVLLQLAWLVRSTWPRTWRRVRTVAAGWSEQLLTTDRRALGALIAVAVSVRVVLALGTHPILWPDSFVFYDWALACLRGEYTVHEMNRTPLYAGFLAVFLWLGGGSATGDLVVAVQRILGAMTTLLVYGVGRAAFSRPVAFWAAALWTLLPLPLYYETAILSETLFVFLLTLGLYCATRSLISRRSFVWFATGLLVGIATLTRPVAKGFVVVALAVHGWRGPSLGRIAVLGSAMLAGYLVVVLPWMDVNRRTYGFFGVSGGEGLWLFLRAFDVDHLEPPAETRFRDVRASYDALRPITPALHYAVRNDLNYAWGYSAFATDRAMFGFALEAVSAHPLRFALNTGREWMWLFLMPKSSVHICESRSGPHLCSYRSAGVELPGFRAGPARGGRALKRALAAYFRHVPAVMPLLAIVAAVSIVMSGLRVEGLPRRRSDEFTRAQAGLDRTRLLLLGVILYFSLLAVVFNTVEDRYRLPIDACLVLFAVHGVSRLARRSTDSTDSTD